MKKKEVIYIYNHARSDIRAAVCFLSLYGLIIPINY